jgi:hypothetical protein
MPQAAADQLHRAVAERHAAAGDRQPRLGDFVGRPHPARNALHLGAEGVVGMFALLVPSALAR